jgi:hypothetical protein
MTESGPLDGKGRFKFQISNTFDSQTHIRSMGFGLWTRPLGLHTLTGQRLQVDYFNIHFFSPKASPLDIVWSRKVTLLLSTWA